MTTLAWAALIAASAFAIGDWWSRARDNRALEYVCKPATLVALLVVALALEPAAGNDDQRVWFVAALVFSLAGDVFLMLPSDRFVAGLASFLVAHVCYVVGFWTDPPEVLTLILSATVVVGLLVPVAARILRAVRESGGPAGPVATYIAVIAAMVASAFASGSSAAAAGAALFAGSDTMIAWNRFVHPFAAASVAIMVTYHLGQAFLVLSLLQ